MTRILGNGAFCGLHPQQRGCSATSILSEGNPMTLAPLRVSSVLTPSPQDSLHPHYRELQELHPLHGIPWGSNFAERGS